MKSCLVAYWSKYGTTKSTAGIIAKELDADLYDIAKAIDVNLDPYNMVIIGVPIYMFTIDRKIKRFLEKRKHKLLNKNLACFVHATMDHQALVDKWGDRWISGLLGEEIANHVFYFEYLGGKRCFNTLDKLDTMMLEMGKKLYPDRVDIEDFDNVNHGLIKDFTMRIKAEYEKS